MLQLFRCKGIDLHTLQHTVAVDYCTCRSYVVRPSAQATPLFYMGEVTLLR